MGNIQAGMFEPVLVRKLFWVQLHIVVVELHIDIARRLVGVAEPQLGFVD